MENEIVPEAPSFLSKWGGRFVKFALLGFVAAAVIAAIIVGASEDGKVGGLIFSLALCVTIAATARVHKHLDLAVSPQKGVRFVYYMLLSGTLLACIGIFMYLFVKAPAQQCPYPETQFCSNSPLPGLEKSENPQCWNIPSCFGPDERHDCLLWTGSAYSCGWYNHTGRFCVNGKRP
ncbi:MAG: hypothetical protein MHM6MM_008080 [Cercozoa sp. M6MM]